MSLSPDSPPLSPLTLRLIGTPELRDAAGTPLEPLLAQPKRLALLVRLVMAGAAGVSRQQLLELFWSDLDDAHARNALRQSLHFLRRHLAQGALLASEESVAVDPSVVQCDAVRAREAFASGDEELALELVTAPLCDGLFVSGAVGFEEWLDGERRHLSHAATEAAWGRSQEAELAGDADAAEFWARRAVLLAPDDLLMRQRHRALRERLAPPRQPVATEQPALVTAATNAPITQGPPTPPTVVRPTRWQPFALLASVAALIVVAGSAAFAGRRPARVAEPDRLAVLPFEADAAGPFAYLREGMVDLLAARLEGVPGLQIVDPRLTIRHAGDAASLDDRRSAEAARSLEVGAALTGSIRDSAGIMIVEATLVRAAGHREGTVRVTAPRERGVFAAVDDLARQLIALRGIEEHDRLGQLAARTTESLDALRAWLTGERDFRAGRYVAATDAFERATRLDSNFAVAHFRYAVAAAYATQGRSEVPRRELTAALRHGERLGGHDRLMVQALFQDWHGRPDSALRLYRRAMGERPDDADAWAGFADATFHQGPQNGTGFESARPYFEQALLLDSTNLSSVVHLGRIAAAQGDGAALRRLAARERALRQPESIPGEVAWLAAVSLEDETDVSAMIAALANAPDPVAADYAWRAATYAADPAVAVRVLTPRVEGDRPQAVRASHMLALAHFEAARARPTRAAYWLDRARLIAPTAALQSEAGVLWATGLTGDALQSTRFRLTRWRTSAGVGSPFDARGASSDLAVAALGLELAIQAAAGNDSLMQRLVVVAERAAPPGVEDLSGVRHATAWGKARLRARVGDVQGALHLLAEDGSTDWTRGSLLMPSALARLERARLLESQGQHLEALRWINAVLEENGHDAVLLPAVLFVRTHALAAHGDRQGAQRAGARLLRLWRDAEPSEQYRADAVRAAMRGDAPPPPLRTEGL